MRRPGRRRHVGLVGHAEDRERAGVVGALPTLEGARLDEACAGSLDAVRIAVADGLAEHRCAAISSVGVALGWLRRTSRAERHGARRIDGDGLGASAEHRQSEHGPVHALSLPTGRANVDRPPFQVRTVPGLERTRPDEVRTGPHFVRGRPSLKTPEAGAEVRPDASIDTGAD